MEKSDIRRKINAMRRMLSEEERQSAASDVFDRLEKTAAFLMADNVLMYHSLPDELSTREFLRKWGAKKHFFLPRVNGVDLDILPYEESRLELGSFHIEEPTGEDTVDPSQIELMVIPAVAYDRNGNRLGRLDPLEYETGSSARQKPRKSVSDMNSSSSTPYRLNPTTYRWTWSSPSTPPSS